MHIFNNFKNNNQFNRFDCNFSTAFQIIIERSCKIIPRRIIVRQILKNILQTP